MDGRRPTMYDVAELASVSTATVSFTYNQPHRVKPKTRDRVLAAAKELGYLPSGTARDLAQGRTGALGLFSFDFLIEQADNVEGSPERAGSIVADPVDVLVRSYPLYADEVQRGIELECWERGYALLLSGGRKVSSEALVADIAGRVDGLAVFPGTVPHEVLLQIARRMPVVELGETAFGDRIGHVTVDNVAAVQALTKHLLEVHDLRDLRFVQDGPGSDNAARFAGFQAAMKAAGLTVPEVPLPAELVPDLADQGRLPQGLVCCTDFMALRVMNALILRGLQVPRDVAVTGFDGLVAGRLSNPALTTVRQPLVEMGRAVVDVLINKLNEPKRAPEQRQLTTAFVQRESCGC